MTSIISTPFKLSAFKKRSQRSRQHGWVPLHQDMEGYHPPQLVYYHKSAVFKHSKPIDTVNTGTHAEADSKPFSNAQQSVRRTGGTSTAKGENKVTHGFGAFPGLKGLKADRFESWARDVLAAYCNPDNREYRNWVQNQRIIEWRRYGAPPRRSHTWFPNPRANRHEFLVIKMQGKTGPIFLRIERYMRDRSIINKKCGNYWPTYWQRWSADDWVSTVEDWPDGKHGLCEARAFGLRRDQPTLEDLCISAVLVHESSCAALADTEWEAGEDV
ncbi:hypothetical protein H0H92_009344 [Tricholoma furcatifolium]|nr:hypothetical protein H0H92_009344 [Tricholoma furcatifolium]